MSTFTTENLSLESRLEQSGIFNEELWTPQGLNGIHAPELVSKVPLDLLRRPVRDFGYLALSETLDDLFIVRFRTASFESIRFPEELKHLMPVFRHIMDVERSLDPTWEQQYVHLDVRQTYVRPGDVQFGPAVRPHIDGFGSPGKRKIRQYVVMDGNELTSYYTQDISIPDEIAQLEIFTRETINGLFEEHIDYQLDSCQTFSPEPGDLLVMDNFCVHWAPVTKIEGLRTFVRLTFCAAPHPGLDYL